MRSRVILATCVLLVALVVSPGVAMAKGGNGVHAQAATKVSQDAKSNAGQDKAAQKPDPGAKPVKTSRPIVTPSPKIPSKNTSASVVKTPPREAPKAEAAPKSQSTASTQPVSRELPPEPIAASIPSTTLAEGEVASYATEVDDAATRGVLDTIEVELRGSLGAVRSAALRVWSALTSWWSD